MNNCLVSQLKAIVADGNNFPVFDSVKFTLNTDTHLEIMGVEVVALEGKTFDVYNLADTELIAGNVTSYTIDTGTRTIRAKSNGTNFLAKGKYYGLQRISFIPSTVANRIPFDISQFAYAKKLSFTRFPNATVDLEGELDISTIPSITNLNFEIYDSTKASLLIPETIELPELQNLTYYCRNLNMDAGLFLDITHLASSKKLTTLTLENNKGVTGSVNTLLDALYNNGNGKVSGNLKAKLLGTNCTYNGSEIASSELNFTFSASGWTAA